MLRLSIAAAAAAFALGGAADAQVINSGAWPAGPLSKDSLASVTARASGQAQGASTFHVTLTISRSAAEHDMAEGMIEAAVSAVKAADGVTIASIRKDAARPVTLLCAPQPASVPAGSPAPLPGPAMQTQVFTASAAIEADAASRDAVNRWAGRLPAQAGPCPGARANAIYPGIIERVADTDPAWEEAARAAIAEAERDAKAAAKAAGRELGPLVNLWTERATFVSNGKVTVQVTAQFEMTPGSRR